MIEDPRGAIAMAIAEVCKLTDPVERSKLLAELHFALHGHNHPAAQPAVADKLKEQ
ncbi:MAG TPA: hypothetical protein VKD24_03465 [Candidatus Angelobacter sp.]|nr:hypothetical protein [Candidatus Angelobacter sp.]